MEIESVRPEEFKAAMASFAAGVTVVTTLDARDCPQALTATAFTSVSVSPPLCLVCIDRRARTHQPLLLRGCFAVSILSSEQEALSARFASRVVDRFAGVSWRPGRVTSCPIIHGALAFMECYVVEVHPGGDHDIFLGRVASVEVRGGAPLVYWRGSCASLLPAAVGNLPSRKPEYATVGVGDRRTPSASSKKPEDERREQAAE